MKPKTDDFTPNLPRCRQFYEQYGAAMIEEHFFRYASSIAVGLAGEGSDCFGFDDPISADHDYGIGFCMWLPEPVYREIGQRLQEEYDHLLSKNFETKPSSRLLDQRRGVNTIGGFYQRILGCQLPEDMEKNGTFALSPRLWLTLPEENLAAAVNGAVFRDDEGLFSRIRQTLLNYYPPEIHRLRLADQLHHFSQNGQYNYSRMMARRDLLTARLCIMQASKSAMAVVYLLNHRYAPYYKWMRKGLDSLPVLNEIGRLLDEAAAAPPQWEAWESISYTSANINHKDRVCEIMEQIASMILTELQRQGFIKKVSHTFADSYCQEIADGAKSDKNCK